MEKVSGNLQKNVQRNSKQQSNPKEHRLCQNILWTLNANIGLQIGFRILRNLSKEIPSNSQTQKGHRPYQNIPWALNVIIGLQTGFDKLQNISKEIPSNSPTQRGIDLIRIFHGHLLQSSIFKNCFSVIFATIYSFQILNENKIHQLHQHSSISL